MSERDSMYSRRVVMTGAGVAAGAILLGPSAWAQESKKNAPTKQDQTETAEELHVSAPEELMRQHAIVDRLLLIYDTAITPQAGTTRPAPKVLASTTQMLRTNVDEHVRLEENYVFPMFQKANKMTDLIGTLREQHVTAKRLQDNIFGATEKGESADTEAVTRDIRAYVRMMQAHTAYEETLLYPQIHTVVSPKGFEQMQMTIWEADRKVLGPEGYAGLVARVADLERSAGITGLAQFTPRLPTGQTAMGTPTR